MIADRHKSSNAPGGGPWRPGAPRAILGVAVLVLAVATAWFLPRNRGSSSPEELYHELEAAAGRDDSSRARQLADELLREYPEHWGGHLYRGQFQADDGNPEQALITWSAVPDAAANFGATARFLEGATLLHIGRADQAEKQLLRSIQLKPTFSRPHERLIGLYGMQLRSDDLRRELQALRKLRPLSMYEGAMFLLAGAPLISESSAIEQLSAYVTHDPRDRHSAIALANYHLLADQPDRAVRLLEPLLPANDGDDAVRGALARSYLAADRAGDAERLLAGRTLSAESPTVLWKAYGRLCARRGAWEESRVAFAHARTRDPFDLEVCFDLATAWQRGPHSDQAADVFGQVALLDDMEQLAWKFLRGADRSRELILPTIVELANVLDQLGQQEEAADWYGRALLLDDQDPNLRARYHRCLELASAAPGINGDAERLTIVVPEWSSASRPDDRPKDSQPGPRSLPQFEDVARSAGLDFQYFTGGSGQKLIIESTGGGVGVLDYDQDDQPDLFFPQGRRLPLDDQPSPVRDRLFRNRGDQTLADVSHVAGVDHPGYGQGCAVGDFNSDGFPDLFVTNVGPNALYVNNGDGTFSDVTPPAVASDDSDSSSAAFADFDGDGAPDVYVVNYIEDWNRVCQNSHGDAGTCDPHSLKAAPDRLYRNSGTGDFEDVSEAGGIVLPGGKGLGIVVADLVGDAQPDVYVANDGTPNCLFRNESRPGAIRFTEIGFLSGCAVNGEGRAEAGMGIACADFDADGRADLFVTNFYQETNTLYLNNGGDLFQDATQESGLAQPSREMLGFGTVAADFDLDGRQDLAVANGHIDDYSAFGRPWKMRPQVFQNTGGARFRDVSSHSGDYFQGEYLGRGMARLDFDRDGRPDLVIVHQDRPVALLLNRTRNSGRFIMFELIGQQSGRDPVGAVITCRAGTLRQTMPCLGGWGYQAASQSAVHFGIGAAATVDELEIRWPSGRVDVWHDLATNACWSLVEGHAPRKKRPCLTVAGEKGRIMWDHRPE